MTFNRFSQLYQALVIDRVPITDPVIVESGASEHLIAALVKVANGDHSEFDNLEDTLKRRKLFTEDIKLIDEKILLRVELMTSYAGWPYYTDRSIDEIVQNILDLQDLYTTKLLIEAALPK